MQIYNDGTQPTPTGGSRGGGRVRIDDFGILIALGHNVSELRSHANTARNRLEGATGSTDAFGSYPAGQSFASHHDAVAKVMSTTMDSVSTDIESFGSNIVTSAKNYRDTDDTAAGCAQALQSVLSSPGTVDDDFDAARGEQGDSLTNVQMDANDAEAAGTQDQTSQMLGGAEASTGEGSAQDGPAIYSPADTGPKTG